MAFLRRRDIFKKVGMFRKHGFRSSRIIYDLFFCFIKYPLRLVCKLFWKTEIFIRSRPTLFSKAISFKCFPSGFLKGPVVTEIAVPNHAKNPLGYKYKTNLYDHDIASSVPSRKSNVKFSHFWFCASDFRKLLNRLSRNMLTILFIRVSIMCLEFTNTLTRISKRIPSLRPSKSRNPDGFRSDGPDCGKGRTFSIGRTSLSLDCSASRCDHIQHKLHCNNSKSSLLITLSLLNPCKRLCDRNLSKVGTRSVYVNCNRRHRTKPFHTLQLELGQS
jgi:hypothetical protein